MCGIAGIVDLGAAAAGAPGDGEAQLRLKRLAGEMARALHHRGPDGRGVWSDPDGGAHLAHTRLAVIDLGPSADQPMLSRDGNLAMVFNGEIYNFADLRTQLAQQGVGFRGHGDSEVLLAAIVQWGLDETLERAAGMFAIALWDRTRRELTLVRDRYGKKPLFVARRGEQVAFASELSALRRWPELAPELDPRAVASVLRLGYVSGGLSILRDVHPLPPGHLLRLSPHTGDATPQRYWSVEERARAAIPVAPDAAEQQVEQSLQRAVQERMVADVPLGALLSGGIDSSLVLALMQQHSDRPVRSFSIGFDEAAYDESSFAAAVASHLGTQHEVLRVDAGVALETVPELARIYDEPFADSSALPMLLISRMTRDHVTVALSGDGGDELFGGYNRHVLARGLGRYLQLVPPALRRALSTALLRLAPAHVDALSRLRGRSRQVDQGLANRLQKLARLSAAPDLDGVYQRALLQHPDLSAAKPGGGRWWPHLPQGEGIPGPAERVMLADAQGYLPDDILVKVDRASMSCALEIRSPFLDHRVCEAAWRLDPAQRIHDGRGKQILRRILARHIPPALFQRPKAGFAVPLDAWLREGLRDWAEALLVPGDLEADGFVDVPAVRAAWRAHQMGRAQLQHALWPVLMLRAWRTEQGL